MVSKGLATWNKPTHKRILWYRRMTSYVSKNQTQIKQRKPYSSLYKLTFHLLKTSVTYIWHNFQHNRESTIKCCRANVKLRDRSEMNRDFKGTCHFINTTYLHNLQNAVFKKASYNCGEKPTRASTKNCFMLSSIGGFSESHVIITI